MSELPPNAIEQEPEHIPSLEEVQGVFEQLLGSEAYVEERRREDEKGLYMNKESQKYREVPKKIKNAFFSRC